MKKITICIFLSLLFSQFLVATEWSGDCGNIHYTFDDTSGVLILSGKGEMKELGINFRNQIKKIIIKNGVTSICDYAFQNCINTTDITIPPSVKKIGQYAFNGCSSLSGIYITDLSAWCKMEMQTLPLNYAKKLFVNGKILTDLVIPDDITYLGLCFQNCTSITSVTIPKNMKKMHSSAFEGCSNLTHIIWNAKDVVSQTGYYSPLYYCLSSQLTNITFGDYVQSIQPELCYKMTKLTSVVIPEGVKTIGDEAFRGCTNLSSITIPSSVKRIGSQVFKECTNLSAIYITDLSAWCKIEYPLRHHFYGENYQGKWVDECDVDKEDLPLFYARNLYLNGKLLSDLVIPNDITEINQEFQYCKSIKSITFPPTVRRIGDYKHYAFTECSNLVSVNWNIKNYTYNAPWTYSNAESIISFTFGPNVEVIPINCCKNMREMTSVTIPPSVKQIKEGAFHDCLDLDSVFITDITAWCAIKQESFPLSWARHLFANGKLVSEVKWSEKIKHVGPAFRFYRGLEKVEIPDGVTGISPYAFQGCCNLQSVTIPSTIQTIGEKAFAGCTGLMESSIPNTIKSIGDNAFENVPNLVCKGNDRPNQPWGARSLNGTVLNGIVYSDWNATTLRACPSTYKGDVIIPSSVRRINENAFSYCSGLTAVRIDDLNNWFRIDFKNENANPLKYAHKLIVGDKLLTNLQVPRIKSINDYAFLNCASLEKVIIPNGVEKIGKSAFSGCSNLQSVDLPTNKITLNEYAFNYCKKLKVVIPSNVNFYYNLSKYFSQVPYVICDTTREGAPWGAKKMVNGGWLENGIVYNDTTKTIIKKCLSETKGDVVIPSSVTKIEARAFRDCAHITSVTIPPSLKEVGDSAFYNCRRLIAVHISDIEAWCSIYFDHSMCSNPLYYAHNLYLNNQLVRDVKLQSKIDKIGQWAFVNCTSIHSITIPNSVTSIEWGAFSDCANLTSVSIPGSVKSIHDWAFSDCSSLININIPDSVTVVRNGVFHECTNLISITIPSNAKTIGDWAFMNCTSLTSVTIPRSVTSIGKSAFFGCTNLTSVTIPKSVTSIGDRAFLCVNNINYSGLANGQPWGAKCVNGYVDGFFVYADATKKELAGCSSNASGHVIIPNCVSSIGLRAFWRCKSLISITIPNSVTSIKGYAFNDCDALVSLEIPNSVTSIESTAFDDVNNINYSGLANGQPWGAKCVNGYVDGFFVYADTTKKELAGCSSNASGHVTIPNSVTSIGNYAFGGCTNLTSVTIPNSVTSIGESAFLGCTNLTSVTIPNSVTSIGKGAFEECKSLSSVTIPNSVNSIGLRAFRGCKSLISITIPNSVTSIGNFAFAGCDVLTSVTIAQRSIPLQMDYNKVFKSCDRLNTIFVPATIAKPQGLNSAIDIIQLKKDSSVLSIAPQSLKIYDLNQNGIIEVDEPCEILFTLCNTGKGEAVGCKVNINTGNEFPFLHVDKEMELPNIPVGDSIHVKIPINTDKNATAVTIPIQLSITEVQGEGVAPITIPVQLSAFASPQLQAEYSLYSSSTSAQRTEPLTVKMVVRNIGKGIARDVSYSIALPNALQHLSGKLQQTWDVIYAGEQKEFSFKINSSEQTPDSLSLDYVIKEKYGLYAQPGYIPIVWNKTQTSMLSPGADDAIFSIDKLFHKVEKASVALEHKDWYKKYVRTVYGKEILDYAIVTIKLQGSGNAIRNAKATIGLDLGKLQMIKDRYTGRDNEIWFLVPVTATWGKMTCGDGCTPITLWDLNEELKGNGVYEMTISVQ